MENNLVVFIQKMTYKFNEEPEIIEELIDVYCEINQTMDTTHLYQEADVLIRNADLKYKISEFGCEVLL